MPTPISANISATAANVVQPSRDQVQPNAQKPLDTSQIQQLSQIQAQKTSTKPETADQKGSVQTPKRSERNFGSDEHGNQPNDNEREKDEGKEGNKKVNLVA